MTIAHPRLPISQEELADFCRKWHIVEFALFGSVVRDDFRDDSDIDVMVRFAPGLRPLGFAYFQIGIDLEELFGRPVDVVEFGTIENPYRRRAIARDLTVVYAA